MKPRTTSFKNHPRFRDPWPLVWFDALGCLLLPLSVWALGLAFCAVLKHYGGG